MVRVEDGVCNGTRKIESEDKMFMNRAGVFECMKSLKCKNSEGYDRIPERILVDGIDCLVKPFTGLFELVYKEMKVPVQWNTGF
jgi:hypothetical protein